MVDYETKEEVTSELINYVMKHGHNRKLPLSGAMLAGYAQRYDNALPDDLPHIPKAVGECIRQDYGENTLFDELALAFQDGFDSIKVNEWIINNEDIFAEAWSRGLWIVEETGEAMSYHE